MEILSKVRRRFVRVVRRAKRSSFVGSEPYWERRYSAGGNSGAGSYGRLASYKAEYIEALLSEHGVSSAIEFGCGDGNQLSLIAYPSYVGVDVSATAVQRCRERFGDDSSKSFLRLCELGHASPDFDLSLSLDVVYHLVEDEAYFAHLDALFSYSRRLVLVYSSNIEEWGSSHVRHRRFVDDVETRYGDWRLARADRNPYEADSLDATELSLASFFLFEKQP